MNDISLIRSESARTAEGLANALVNAHAHDVKDERSYLVAEAVIRRVKEDAQALDDKLTEWVTPLKRLIKLATDDVRPRLNTADEVERILKAKCIAYRARQAEEKAVAEHEARRQLEAARKDAATAPLPPARLAEVREALTRPVALELPKTSSTFVDNYKTRIVDQSKIPAHFWVRSLSQALLDAAVAAILKSGRTPAKDEIPGIEIYNDPYMKVFKK